MLEHRDNARKVPRYTKSVIEGCSSVSLDNLWDINALWVSWNYKVQSDSWLKVREFGQQLE